MKSIHHRWAGAAGLAIAIGVAGWSLAAGAPDRYALDAAHTSATFKIEHLGISWISGRFNDVSGTCAVDKADPANCSFEVAIKATSIDTNNAQRDEHLRSDDFFNVKQFPEMTFKSTSVRKAATTQPAADGPATKPTQDDPKSAATPSDAVYEVTGDFTMHGMTKPVTFVLRGGKEAEFPKGTQRIGFFAEFALKRSDYGMGKLPGAVGDVVKITVSFEATRQ